MNRRRALLPLILCLAATVRGFGGPSSVPANTGGAWSEVEYLNFRGALSRFRQARRNAPPGSRAWIEAGMGLALCYQHRQPDVRSDKEKAAKIYDQIIRASEGNPLQAAALLMRARLADQIDYYGDKPDPETARRLYLALLEKWPASPLTHRAVLYLAQLDIFTMTETGARRGIRRLKRWLAAHPHNPLAYLQWELIAYAAMGPLHAPATAVDAFRQAEKSGLPPFTQRDAFYWRLANLALQAGDRRTAAGYFRRIITEVRRSGFAYEAQQRLRALGIEPPPLPDPFDEAPPRASRQSQGPARP